MNVTGYCFPCKNIQEAAMLVEIERISGDLSEPNETIKMGKEAGVWYVCFVNGEMV